jgi:hypothetical protein
MKLVAYFLKSKWTKIWIHVCPIEANILVRLISDFRGKARCALK